MTFRPTWEQWADAQTMRGAQGRTRRHRWSFRDFDGALHVVRWTESERFSSWQGQTIIPRLRLGRRVYGRR